MYFKGKVYANDTCLLKLPTSWGQAPVGRPSEWFWDPGGESGLSFGVGPRLLHLKVTCPDLR